MMMMRRRRRKRLLSSLRLRGTSSVSLHERFSQVLRDQQTSKLTFNPSRLSRRCQARSSLSRTGLWTRLGWLKVTQELCGFWSFKNKYGWRARFNGRGMHAQLGRRRFLKTQNLRTQTAGQVGQGRQVKARTLQSLTAGRSGGEVGLGPRCVTMTGHMQRLTPGPTWSAPEPPGLHGSLAPVESAPGPRWGGDSVFRGRGHWKTRLPTRSQLDKQLDEYMSMSKSRLDAELDEYMSMTPAHLDAELDEYKCQARRALLD